MGFSVSGSALVVFIGVFLAVGTAYSVAANTGERLSAAQQDQLEHYRAVANTGINIASVSSAGVGTCGIEVRVNNTGTEPLTLNHTDLLLDNEYLVDWQADASVDGETITSAPDTRVWAPGEQVVYENTSLSAAPERVKVVTESGVADSREVTFSC